MKRKKTIILIAILIIAIVIVYMFFFRGKEAGYSLEKVVLGNVTQEVSETGMVKMGEEISLSFKNAGKIEKIYVQVGDTITAGQNLAQLDTSQLIIQLAEAKATLRLAEAKESDAQISLESAERDLNNTKNKAEQDLNNAYENAINVLDSARLKIYNAFNAVHGIQKTYFSTPNEYGLKVGEEKYRIESSLERAESLVKDVKNNPQHEDIDSALSEIRTLLEKVSNALKGVRDITENAIYRELVSSTDKTSLDTQKTNINTAIDNVTSAQQTISTTKITNATNINNTEATVDTLRSQLQSGAAVGLYQAQINQAQAQVALLEKQIQDATLKSPTDGKIIKLEKEEGETAQTTEVIISLLPASPFQIEVDIYEEDIVKVEAGNQVDIDVAAFPGQVFKGKVISIDPAEKLIEGVVYYEVTINFEEYPEQLKPGMTADIDIKVAQRDNVLVIPEGAIEKKNGKTVVQVLKGKKIEEREIKIGLKGTDGLVEVISDLKEGEQVIIK